MSDKQDFEKRNRPFILERLGMEDLGKQRDSAPEDTLETSLPSEADKGPCPDHPLGQDLFYVLRNAHWD